MHEVIVYSREGCHLCDVIKDTLSQLETKAAFNRRVIDIDSDPELRQKYNEEVPVVFINNRKAFKYHLDHINSCKPESPKTKPGACIRAQAAPSTG